MTTTTTDVQSLIIAELGDTPDYLLTTNMPAIWASYAEFDSVAPRLHELYAKRRACDLLLASLRSQVDSSMDGGISLKLSQRTAYLVERRTETNTEIAKWERVARANRVPAQAALTTTEMESPPFNLPPDANDERYRGSPYAVPLLNSEGSL